MRTHLDEGPEAVRPQAFQRAIEAHRLAQVAAPVVRVEFRTGCPLPRHARIEGDLRIRRGKARELLAQGGQQHLHVRAVGRVVHVHALAVGAGGLHLREEAVQRLGVSGHNGRARGVHHRDGQRLAVRRQLLGDFAHRALHEAHRPVRRVIVHGPGAQRHDASAVRQAQRPADDRRGHLPLTVADDRRGLDAPGAPHRGETDVHREQRRLHHVRTREGRRETVLPAHDRGDREPGVRGEGLVAGRHRLAERVVLLPQRPAHPPPLGALAGEDERDAAAIGSRARHHRVVALVRGERPQTGHRLVRRAGDHRAARGVVRAGRRQRLGDVGQPRPGRLPEVARQPCGVTCERVRVRPGHRQADRTARIRCGLYRGALGCLAEGDMSVGSAVSEAAHPREPRPGRPRGCLGDHFKTFGGEVDARVRCAEVQARRNDAVVHRQRGLDEPEHAGRRFEVAEVRLHRADA
ncbi:hypothetical protein SMICM17S_04675 [Streptomyces microflavus]